MEKQEEQAGAELGQAQTSFSLLTLAIIGHCLDQEIHSRMSGMRARSKSQVASTSK